VRGDVRREQEVNVGLPKFERWVLPQRLNVVVVVRVSEIANLDDDRGGQ
jgi:hypothetical protein